MQDNETLQFDSPSYDSSPKPPPDRIDDNPLDGDYGNYTFGQLQNDKVFNDAVDSKDSKAVYKMYHSFKQGLNRRLIDRASRGELTLDQLDGKVWNALEYEKAYMKKAGLEKYEPLMENGNFTPPSLDNLELRTLHGKLAPEFREIIRSKVSEEAAAKKPEAALGAFKDLLQYEDPETGKRESLIDAWSVNRWGSESDPDGERMNRWRKEADKYGESRGMSADEVLDQIAELVMKQEVDQGGDTRLSTDNGVSIGGGLYVNSGAVVIGSPTSVDEAGSVLGMLNDSSLAKQAILKSSATDNQKLRGLRVLGAVRENLAFQLWTDTIIAGYGDNRSASEAILKNIATKGLYYFLAEESDDFSRFEENYKLEWEKKNGSVTRKLQKDYRTDLTIAFALERHENAGLWAGLEDNVFATVDTALVSSGVDLTLGALDAFEGLQGLQKKLYGVEGSDAIQGMQDNFRGSLIEAKDSVEYVNAARQRIRKLDYGRFGNFTADVSGVVGYAIPAVVATAVVSRVAAPMVVAGGTGTAATVGKYAHRAMTSITQGLTTAAQAYSSSTYSTYQKLLDRAYDEGVKLTPAKEKELWQTAGQSAVGGAAANGALTMAVTALAGPIGRGIGVSGDTVLGKAGKLGSGTLDDTTLMTMLLSSSSRGAVLRQAKDLLRDKKVRGLFIDAIKNSDKKLIGGMKDWGKREAFDKVAEGIEEGLAGGSQALLDAIGEQKLGFENDGLFDAFTSSFAEEAVMGIVASVPMNSVMGNTAAAKAYFSDKNNINTAIGKVFARNKAFAAKLEGIKGGVDESTAYEALVGLKKNGELEAAKALEVIVKESKVSPPQPAPQGSQQPPPMPGTSGGTETSERVGNMQGSSGTVNIDIKKGDERMDTLVEVDHPVYGIGRYSQIKSVGSENIIGKGVVYSQAKDKASLAAQPKVSEPNERGETTVTYQVAYRESSEGKRAKYKPTDRQVELIVDKDGVVISSKIGSLISTTPQVKPTVTQRNQTELHTTPQDSKAVEEGRLYTVLSKFTPLSRATVAQISRGSGGRAFLGALRSIIGRTIPSTFTGKYMTEKPISVSDARSQLDALEEGLNEGAYEGLTPQEKNQLVRSINDVRERLDQFESDPLPFYGGDAKSLLARTAMDSIEAREAGKLNSSHVDEKAYKAITPKPIPVKKPLPTPPPRKEQSNAEPQPQPQPESGTEPEPESPDLATENDTVNVWAGTGENTILSNLSSRPFQYNGRDYLSVEHAYQTLKSGEFDQETYDAYNKEGAGRKIIGKKPVNKAISEALMENLIEASMMQNESARNALLATGNATITHTQEKSGIWGDAFPRILMDVRERLRSEQQVQSTTEGQTDQASETTEPIIGDLVTNPDGSQSMFLGEGVYVSIPNEQQAIGEVSDFTNAVKRAGLNLEGVITSKIYEILDGLVDDGSFPVTVVVDNTIPSAAELAYPEGTATSGVIRINLEKMNQLRMANPSLVAKGILHEIHHVATIRQYVRENGGAEIAIEKIAELGRQVKANDNASTMLREGYPTTTQLSDVNAGLEYLAVLHERVLTGESAADSFRAAGLLPGENMTIIERWLNAAKRMAEAMFGMKDIPGVSDMLKRIELSLRASEAYKAEQSALASRVQQSRVQLSNSLKEMVANVEEAANQVSPPTPPEPVADSRTTTQPKKKDIIFTEIVEDDGNSGTLKETDELEIDFGVLSDARSDTVQNWRAELKELKSNRDFDIQDEVTEINYYINTIEKAFADAGVDPNLPKGLPPTQAPVFEEGVMSRGEAEAVLFALHKHAAIGGVTRYGDGILRLQDDEFVLSVAPEALPIDAEEQARMSFYGDVPPTINEVNQAINFLNDVGGTGLNFRQYLSSALPTIQAALENLSDPTTPEEEKSRKGLQDQVAAIKEAQGMISVLLGQSTKLDFDATPQGEWLASSKDFNDKYRDVANNVTMHSENHVGAQMMHMWGDFDESGQFSLAAVSKDILRGSAINDKPTTDVYIPLNRKAVGLLRQAVNYTNKENPWFMRRRKKKGEDRVIKPSEVPLSNAVKNDLRREIGKARAIYESNNPTKSWESLYTDQKPDRSIELIADKVFAGKDGRLYLKVPSLQQIHGTDESGRKVASSENAAILKTLAYQEAVTWHDQYQEGNFDRDSLYGSVLESHDFYINIATRMGLDKPDKINTFDKLKKALGHKGIFPTSDTKIPFLDTSAAVRALPSEFTEKYTRAVTEAMDEVLPDNHPYKKWISQLKSEFANIDKRRMSGTDRVKAIDNTRFVANNLSSFSLQFARQMASVMWMNASGSHKMRGVVGQLIDLGLMAHFDKSYNATGKPSGFRVVRAKSTADLIKSVGLVSETEWDNMLTDLNALNLIGVKQSLELDLSQGDPSRSDEIAANLAEVDAQIGKVSRSVMKRLTDDERTDTGQSVVDRAYSILSSGFDRFADKDNTALTKRTVLLAHIFDADTTAMRKFVTETINKKDSDLDAAIYEKLTQMVMSEIKVKNGMRDLAASILTDIQYRPMPANEGAAKQDVMSVLGSHDLPFEYIHKFIDDTVDDNGNINPKKVGESVDGMLSGLREDYRKNREQLEQAEASIEDADSYQIARVRAQAELYRRALDRIERNANTLKEMLPTLQYSGVTLGSLDESQYRDLVTLILNNDSVNVFSSSNEWAAYSVNDSLFSSFGTSEYESGGDSISSAPIHPVVSDFFTKYDDIPIITYNSSSDWRKVVGTKGSGLVIDADGEVAAIVHDMDNPYSWRSLGNQIIDYTLSRSLESSDKAKEVLDTVRGVLHRSQMATLGDARVTRDSRLSIGTDQDLMLTTDEINRAESMNETYTTHVQGLENELLNLRRQKRSLQGNPILLAGENVGTEEADYDGSMVYGPQKEMMASPSTFIVPNDQVTEQKSSDMETAFKQKEFDQQKAKLKEDIDSLEDDIQGVLVDLNKASITALKEQNIKPNDNPYFQFSSERKANMLGVSFADTKKVETLRADTIEAENARDLSLDKYFDGIERQIARLESELASEDTQVNEENLFSLAAETAYEGDLGMVGQTRLVKHAKAKLNDLKDQRSASKERRISKYKHSYKMADWQISSKEIIQKIKNGKSVFSQIADIAVLAETLSANADSSMDRARAAETAKKMSEINDALQIEVLVKQLEGYEQIVKVYDVGFKRRDKKVKETKEIKGHRAKMLASKEKANSLDKKIANLKKENKDSSELESKLSDQNRITEHHTQMGKILTSILQQHNPTAKNPSPDMSKILISRNEAERVVDKLKARITRAVNVGKDTELDGDSLRELVGYTSNALMPLAEKMIRPVTQEVAYRVIPGSKTKRDITKIDNVLKRLGSSSFMRMSNHELLKAMITSPELIQLLSDLPEQDIALMESAFRRSYVFKKGTKSHIEYMTSLFTAMEQTLISNASKVDVTFDTVEAEIAAENETREEADDGGVDSTPNTYERDSMVVLEDTGYTDTQRIQAISGLLSAVFHSLNNPDAANDVSNANSERWEVIQEKVKSRARGADDYDAALEQEIEELQSVELYQKTYAGMESVSLMRYLQQSSGGKTYIAIPQTLQDRLAIKKSAQAINGAWDNVWGTPTYDEELAERLNYIKSLITHPDTERLGKALLLDEINKGGDKLKPFAQLETSDLAPYIVHKKAQIDAVKSDYVELDKYTIGDSPATRSEWINYRIDQLEKKIGENTRTHSERLSKYNVASDMTLVHHMWSMDQASQYQTDKPLVLHAESISEKNDVVTAPHILIAAGIHQRTRYVADKINNIKKSLLALNNNIDPFTEALMKFSDQAVFDADSFADSAEYIVEQMQAIQGTHNTLPEGKTKRVIEYTTVLLDKLSEMFVDENGNIDGSDVKVKESIRLVTSIQDNLNTSTLDTTVDDVMEAMPDLGQKVDWKTQSLEGDVTGNIGEFFKKYRGSLGATTSNESLDRFADSIRFLDDISTEIKRDETEVRGLEIQKNKMETMRDNVRFETDVLPSEGLDMIINHWLARTRSESRADALGIERIQYKDLLPKKAGKISYAEQTEALKDATELMQNILEESDEALPSPYERAVLHGGLGSIKSRSKGLGGLEPTRAVVLPSRMKKPVVLSPGQLPKESRLYSFEEVDTFVGDTLVGEITSDFSYFLNGSQPLAHEARQFSRWVKKSMIANNDVFSDLAKSAAGGNTHAKNVVNQMEVMINDLIAITDDANASQDVREHANFALKNFSEGDLRSAQREYHVVLACVLAVPFMEAVRKGSNPNKAAAALVGKDGARFAHIDAKIFHKFSRDIEARKVMFHILQTVDDGIDGKSGRNAAIRENKSGDKPITVAASNLGTAVESYEATMVGQVLGYIDDDNLSPLEMLEKNLNIYESSKDTMLNAKGIIKGKSRYKRTIKKQIKVIEDLTPKIRKAASQIDPSLTKEQFFDELEVKLFEMLNEDQINFIQVSRQEFKDRYESLAAVMAIQGRELGRIHNYLPITSYRRDDSDKNDFILNMQYTPDGSYGRSRYEGDEETAINLDGASTFSATLASMSYSINTTTTYSAMGSLFGGVDSDSEIKYESEDERPEPMVNKFLEINGQNNIYADDASVFAKKMIIEVYENDNPQNPEEGILKDVMMKATELGYKQGLLSVYQPIRQTVPVITSYTLRNMLLNPRKVARFFSSAYKLLANKEYKDVIKEKVLAHAPSISFRALDGNEVINNSVLKSFRKMPLHKKAGWLVTLPFRAAWRLGDKVMNTLLGKPDQWLMHAMIATEYEHHTGDSLADENASFDPTSFAYSRAIVEGTLAQSDKSKKAQLLQSSGYISRAASAFSNHVLSTASTGRAGLSLVRNSTTLEGKREGLSMASDFIFQTLIFTGLSTSNAIYFIAKAIGENEEEEEKIQKELLDKLSSPISKDGLMASAFNMDAGEVEGMNQILGEVERRPMDSQKFFHRFFWRSGVQATGVVSPLLSLSLVNRLLEGVSTAGLELATGKEFTHKGTVADQQTASFQLLGAAGVAATNTYKYIQTYTTGDDWEDRDFDHRDVLYLASQILYNREQRYRLQRDIQKRDNVPVWDMSKKKGEPLINIDNLLDKL